MNLSLGGRDWLEEVLHCGMLFCLHPPYHSLLPSHHEEVPLSQVFIAMTFYFIPGQFAMEPDDHKLEYLDMWTYFFSFLQ